jgi:heme-degrading monooxygenase HmoA
MIARIWRGIVERYDAVVYLEYLQRTGVPDYQATSGNLGVTILQRDVEDVVEFTLITYWESMEAIRTFAGENPERARYYPEDRRYLLDLEPTVEHFEVPFTDLPIGETRA